MKKLSDLVRVREKIVEVYDTGPISQQIDILEIALRSIGQESVIEPTATDIAEIVQDLDNVHKRITLNNRLVELLLESIDREIARESQKFLSDNYNLELRVEHEAVSNIRKVRVLELGPQIQQEVVSRIILHTDWKYPALEIGCRDGELTRHMVAADPLYITDHYRDFIESTVEQYDEIYQRRIRPYLIRDANFSALPQGQFGFVLCWNFLNYRSLDTVKEYLKAVKELLRPGGIFMFSYNNGDMHECAGYAEGHWMSFIPKTMLVPLCESLGYEVYHTRENRGEGTVISWIELKRPGELRTVKAHQVLGEIKRREL